MKLYRRVDGMSWRAVEETPCAVVGRTEHRADGMFDFSDTASVADCVFIPAPDAERAVKAWAKVKAVLDRVPTHGTTHGEPESKPQFLRELAKYIADDPALEVEAAYHLLNALADALEEADEAK